jgi:hypothetical protein
LPTIIGKPADNYQQQHSSRQKSVGIEMKKGKDCEEKEAGLYSLLIKIF